MDMNVLTLNLADGYDVLIPHLDVGLDVLILHLADVLDCTNTTFS